MTTRVRDGRERDGKTRIIWRTLGKAISTYYSYPVVYDNNLSEYLGRASHALAQVCLGPRSPGRDSVVTMSNIIGHPPTVGHGTSPEKYFSWTSEEAPPLRQHRKLICRLTDRSSTQSTFSRCKCNRTHHVSQATCSDAKERCRAFEKLPRWEHTHIPRRVVQCEPVSPPRLS